MKRISKKIDGAGLPSKIGKQDKKWPSILLESYIESQQKFDQKPTVMTYNNKNMCETQDIADCYALHILSIRYD